MKKFAFVLLALVACGKAEDKKASDKPAPTDKKVVDDKKPAKPDDKKPAVAVDQKLEIKPYTPAADVPDEIKKAVTAADRADADKAKDWSRKPGEMAAFFKLAAGQKVGELFAGGGYTTEIEARVVGDTGKVWAQNTTEILEKFARKPLTERLAKPINKNVVLVEKPMDAPLPDDAKDLDAVLCVINYHDAVWMKVDRAKMNKAVFDALKPGGVYGIIDASAVAGHGDKDAESLHRIDEDLVKKEVTEAGFKLDASSDMFRNPDDKRDWNSSPSSAAPDKKGTEDRFTLRFVKPAK